VRYHRSLTCVAIPTCHVRHIHIVPVAVVTVLLAVYDVCANTRTIVCNREVPAGFFQISHTGLLCCVTCQAARPLLLTSHALHLPELHKATLGTNRPLDAIFVCHQAVKGGRHLL
jgi:hypothetical protein